jgi:hypothetical protein
MISSGKLTTAERREKTEELIKEHLWKFQIIEEEAPLYIPKSAYVPREKTEKYVSFFPSELLKQKDIYTEFVSYDLTPEDATRTLYRLRCNPYFDEEYEKTEGENFRYLIPVKELEKIEIKNPESDNLENDFPDFTTTKQISLTEDLFPEETESITKNEDKNEVDELLTSMTIRDFAAIMWKSPVSNKEWLNQLIKK